MKQLDLIQFSGGTEGYHRSTFVKGFVHTDGVDYLAREAECYWLIDAIASYQGAILDADADGFQVWTLEDDGDGGAHLKCWSDTPYSSKLLVSQHIELTDFPFEKLDEPLRIWVEGVRESGGWVALLPQEH